MILPFSTQLNGKETFFVDKIWSGLIDRKLSTIDMCRAYETARKIAGHKPFAIVPHYKPKIHTFREDKNNRWKVGTNIDFFINVRQKSMFRFAPVLPVVSIQKIEIVYKFDLPVLFIDNIQFYNPHIKSDIPRMLLLANNDGFDSVDEFFEYFNKDFKGKIIHWTDIKY